MQDPKKNETGEQNGDDRNLEIKPNAGTDNANTDKKNQDSIGPTGNPHNVDTDPNGDNRTETGRKE